MSTTKTVKVQKNKVLTYSINKSGFQTVNKSIIVTDNVKITENLVAQSGSPIQQLGDRLLGISTYVCDFTPSGTYDVDSLKFINAKQTVGSGLSDFQVVKSLWLNQVETTLGITTPKGTSNTFTFTYNGSTWDLTGATTQNAISTQDLADVYGVSFSGTAVSGDVITVVETQYNKFAVYVLDSNYRLNNCRLQTFIGHTNPVGYNSGNPNEVKESASFTNNYYINLDPNSYPAYATVKNKGLFILPNGLKINALIPNFYELLQIYNNRIALDSFDPVIQAGGTDNNLTNWAFVQSTACSCTYDTGGDRDKTWTINYSGTWKQDGNDTQAQNKWGCAPVFEVPVM